MHLGSRIGLAVTCTSLALLAAPTVPAAEKLPPLPIPKPVIQPRVQLQLEIEAPQPNELIGAADGKLVVAGRALSAALRGGRIDVMVIIDTSASTAAPAGADIDGDGVVGHSRIPGIGRMLSLPSSDRDDSILAAEIAAARTLLDQLDPRSTRVGVVAFAGDSHGDTPDARVVAPLTNDFGWVDAALDGLAEAGPRGRTNIQAAILRAARELSGGPGSQSNPIPGTRKIALLMTDGQPTLPDATSRRKCGRLAIDAALAAAHDGIRIDTYAVGPGATDEPWVMRELAAATEGLFTPVVAPGELVAAFHDVQLSDVSAIQISNLTTRKPADQVRLEPDGWFTGIVELAQGRNRIEIRALASDGRRILRVVDARLAPGAQAQALSPRLMDRRTRMLETRLDHTRNQTLELEVERDEQLRDALADQMKSKREQQRSVEIAGEKPAASEPGGDAEPPPAP
jgi:hypothetical protein